MQCANPKVFRIRTDYLRREYTVFIPCGKCYACECSSRAEWALRMKYEFRDKRNTSAYFLLLLMMMSIFRALVITFIRFWTITGLVPSLSVTIFFSP